MAKSEATTMLRAFEVGAEGVFVAGCGEQCARDNTDFWVRQRMAKVRRTLTQLNLEPERLQSFTTNGTGNGDIGRRLEEFAERIGTLYLASIIMQEVRK